MLSERFKEIRLCRADRPGGTETRRGLTGAPAVIVGSPDNVKKLSEADIYRARIDALRQEVGDSWLKVLSQSGGSLPSPTSTAPSPSPKPTLDGNGVRVRSPPMPR